MKNDSNEFQINIEEYFFKPSGKKKKKKKAFYEMNSYVMTSFS